MTCSAESMPTDDSATIASFDGLIWNSRSTFERALPGRLAEVREARPTCARERRRARARHRAARRRRRPRPLPQARPRTALPRTRSAVTRAGNGSRPAPRIRRVLLDGEPLGHVVADDVAPRRRAVEAAGRRARRRRPARSARRAGRPTGAFCRVSSPSTASVCSAPMVRSSNPRSASEDHSVSGSPFVDRYVSRKMPCCRRRAARRACRPATTPCLPAGTCAGSPPPPPGTAARCARCRRPPR